MVSGINVGALIVEAAIETHLVPVVFLLLSAPNAFLSFLGTNTASPVYTAGPVLHSMTSGEVRGPWHRVRSIMASISVSDIGGRPTVSKTVTIVFALRFADLETTTCAIGVQLSHTALHIRVLLAQRFTPRGPPGGGPNPFGCLDPYLRVYQ